MSADFNWWLSRQGPRGMQGIQGIQGFSPVITVEQDTPAAYILRIQTQNDTFLTTNLRGSVEDLGGTYVRYNRDTGAMYAGDADVASTTQQGIVRMASEQDIAELTRDAAVTPFNVNSMINNNPTVIDLQNQINTNKSDISAIQSNYVTTNTNQTITAEKTFSGGGYEFTDERGRVTVRGELRATSILSVGSGTNMISYHDANGVRWLTIGSTQAKVVVRPTLKVEKNGAEYDVVSTQDIATADKAGIIKPDGTTITIDADGTIHSAASEYTLPIASSTELGGVKVGEGLEIAEDGTLKATAPVIDTTNLAKLNESNYYTGDNNFTNGLKASEIILTQENDKPNFADNAVIIQSASDSRPIRLTPSWMGGDIGLTVKKDGLVYKDEAGNVTDLLVQQPSGSVNDKYGIRGDYSTHFGIIDCPNGLINYSATSKDITLQAGVILKAAGNNNIKTTIASPITYTVTSTGEAILFYAGGEILEATTISYSTEEPADNGSDAFQAWYNPELGKWQFKSNSTGNVWREAIATPIANINSTAEGLTRVDYIGYRVLDDDILVTQQTLAPINELVNTLQQTISQLEARIASLEAEINGGGADGSLNAEVRGASMNAIKALETNSNTKKVIAKAKEVME